MTILLDFLIAFTVIEIAAIAWRRYRRGELGEFSNDLAHLGSGVFLMLAVRLAWTQESAVLVIVLVTLSGMVHALDMIRRFKAESLAQRKAPRFEAPVVSAAKDRPYEPV